MINPANINLVDSHCHLHSIDLTEFDNDMNIVLSKALENSVSRMLCVCVELEDLPSLYKLADNYPQVSISVGIHPNTILSDELTVDKLISLAEHPSCIAIGETGLDYFRTESEHALTIQRNRFREHIRASIRSSKPLIIHTRNASEDTLKIMKEENADQIGGVMHCFSEDWDVAKRALDLNFYISFSGIVTFKNATVLHDVARKVPLDRLLIETDSPYLAPVPFRGKQNHPALVLYVAKAISELRKIDYKTVAQHSTQNFYTCFNVTQS